MRWVEIEFDCLPLRNVGRTDPPLDASPVFQAFWRRVTQALARHGAHHSYYLHRGVCLFHLTNTPQTGALEFRFEGTVLTDPEDQTALSADLDVSLGPETCSWLTEPVVGWFEQTVSQAVVVEFGKFIDAGDLEKTRQRLRKLEQMTEDQAGFLGMYL